MISQGLYYCNYNIILTSSWIIMKIRRLFDTIDVALTFFYVNRKLMVISIIGLIIALASISQTIIYLDSIKSPLFSETLDYRRI